MVKCCQVSLMAIIMISDFKLRVVYSVKGLQVTRSQAFLWDQSPIIVYPCH